MRCLEYKSKEMVRELIDNVPIRQTACIIRIAGTHVSLSSPSLANLTPSWRI